LKGKSLGGLKKLMEKKESVCTWADFNSFLLFGVCCLGDKVRLLSPFQHFDQLLANILLDNANCSSSSL
jgi:hypothetical protein